MERNDGDKDLRFLEEEEDDVSEDGAGVSEYKAIARMMANLEAKEKMCKGLVKMHQ